jgi:raffinose/stachyose/melibiose transport system substrate-binding protein
MSESENSQSTTVIARKEFLGTSAKVAAGAAAVAGLGGASLSARAARVEVREAAAPVILTWVVEFTDTPDQQAVTQYLIKPYEQLHPNVTIKLQAPAASSNIDHLLQTQFAAGAGPDIYDEQGPSFMPPFITNGDAADMTKYAQKYGWKNKLSSFALQSSLYKGKLNYLPTEFEAMHLWYNKTLMTKHGWKVPTTYDEMMVVCKEIKAAGLIPFAFGLNGYLGAWDWWYSYFLNAYLGTKKLYKVLVGQVPWTDPDVATSFQMMKQIWDAGYIMNKQASAVNIQESWAIWGQQKAVLRVEGTWGFTPGLVYLNAKGFDWDIAPLPTWKPGIDFEPPVGIGEVVGINPRSKNVDVAADFFDFAFFRNPSQILKWLPKLSSTYLPPLKWQARDFATGFDPRLAKAIVSTSKAMASGVAGYLSWTAWPAKTEAYMWGHFEDILYGRQTIAHYLKNVDQVFRSEKSAGALPLVPKPAGM